jgi:hypothetical protein
MSRELKGLPGNHVACLTNKSYHSPKTNAYQSEFAMMQAAINSFAGFNVGSDTQKAFKDVLSRKNQAGCWASMEKAFHTMEIKDDWEIVLISSKILGRMVVGN